MKKGQYVVVRGDRSGIFFGKLGERNGREVTLYECRRLWYWDGAASISQIALEGVSKPDNCKFTVTLEELTLLDAIEIIPATDKAVRIIKEVAAWRK